MGARKIARIIGVVHTTVSRWLEQPEFLKLVKGKAPITPVEKLMPVIKAACIKHKE